MKLTEYCGIQPTSAGAEDGGGGGGGAPLELGAMPFLTINHCSSFFISSAPMLSSRLVMSLSLRSFSRSVTETQKHLNFEGCLKLNIKVVNFLSFFFWFSIAKLALYLNQTDIFTINCACLT